MTLWDKITGEVQGMNRPDAIDEVRRQKLERVHQITGRALVIYTADWMNAAKSQMIPSSEMSIDSRDKDGFDQVTYNLKADNVDILLHSPGGSAEATESIVAMLRSRFKHIRFIVPSMAKSAATMLAMSGDQILMDDQSELGPIDPQMILVRDSQVIVSPAQTIKDQFLTAQKEIIADPNKLPAWLPILRQYGPSLLAECDNHLHLAEELVAKWLKAFMFQGQKDAGRKAKRVARYLNSHNRFRSHGRRIGIEDLQPYGLNLLDLRTDPALHLAIRELFIAITITFGGTGAYKIFENHQREALIHQLVIPQLPIPPGHAGVKPASPRLPKKRRK